MFTKVRFFAITLVFGVWCVQQMACLPSVVWLVSALIFSSIIFLFPLLKTGVLNATFLNVSFLKFPKKCLLSSHQQAFFLHIAIFLCAIIWASTHAYWRLSDSLPPAWEQKTILLQGVVAGVPEVTERGERFKFDVEKILTPYAKVPQHISLNFYQQDAFADKSSPRTALPYIQQFHAGERWQLSVKLKRPHGALNPHGFDFEAWALSENIRATGTIKTKAGVKKIAPLVWQPTYLLEYWREKIKLKIANVLAEQPYFGVIQALVMGDDSQINADVWQVFLRTGTTHLMSISGLHITMLAGLGFAITQFFWRRFPQLTLRTPARKAATLAGAFIALSYALLAGFSVPTQRTFYMLMVFAVALWSGRQWALSQVLCLALLVIILIDPWAVNAAGFWLSFGAVAMIGFVLNGRIRPLSWVRTAFVTQWAVTIGMLPILLIFFHQTSVISPIANALAIPVISFLVTPLALLGSFLPSNTPLVLANAVLNLLMQLLVWLNAFPIVTWQQASPPVWTVLPAVLGVLFLLLPRGVPLRFLGLAGLIPMLFITHQNTPLGEMQVTVLDVGQGLSVVVRTEKHTLLYDTGPKFNAQSDAGSRIVVPYLFGEGVKKIDALMVSHDDIDHSGGMYAIMKLLPVQQLMTSFMVENISPNIQKMACEQGQNWVWDQVRFEVLYPTAQVWQDATLKDNNHSCVLKITSQAGSLLLTGDIEKEAENILLSEYAGLLKSDVLLVPHHGSKTSSQTMFIKAVSPQISIFTAGYLNRFGHPKPIILSRYNALESRMYRSDAHGAILLSFKKNAEKTPVIQAKAWRDVYQKYWLNDTY